FQTEAEKQQIELQLVLREDVTFGVEQGNSRFLLHGQNVPLPDFIINRTIEPLLQHIFSAANVLTFNEAVIAEICNHKSKTHLALNKLNIPMMPTYFVRKDAPPSTLPLPFPFVVKEATGRSGQQIYYCTTE